MIYRILIALLLLTLPAHANKWTRTNDVNGLSLNPATLTGTVGQIRLTVYVMDGSSPKDLTGLAAWLAVVDVEDSYSTITPAQIITPTNGHVIGLTSLEAGTYTARLMAGYSTNDSLAFPIAWETIVITNPPSAGGGGGGGTGVTTLVTDGPLTGSVSGSTLYLTGLSSVVSGFAGIGTTGTVTAAAGDAGKYLQADGTWGVPSVGVSSETGTLSDTVSRGGNLGLSWASNVPAQSLTGSIPDAVRTASSIPTNDQWAAAIASATASMATGGQWNAQVNGASNRAESAYTLADAATTTAEAQALATAAGQAANATSVQGRVWSGNAPPTVGSVPYWTGTEIDWSPAPPASSTGSVSSVNNTNGNITIEGGTGVLITRTGTIINVSAAGESVVKNIASYTYVGGEASVTLSFDPLYNPVFVSLTGDYVGDGGTNILSANGIHYGVNINGKTNGYRVAFAYNSYHASYPASMIADLTQKYLRLQNVPSTNNAVNANFGISPLPSGSSWEFLASPRGISCFGRGFSISYNGQEYASFFQVGSLSTNDYVNRNFITQLTFAAYAATSGVQYVARSNATIRVWGLTQ